MSVFDRPLERQDALMTDLYQLTMAAAYFENGIEHSSTFELFTRRLEAGRGYLVACGLELCLDHLEGLRFTGEQISYLRHLHAFEGISPRFFERLRDFRFTGDVWAVPEGTPFFPDEPILRISGPALEAQLVETYLLSIVNFETLIATKATRVLRAARQKHVSDFGTRRAHGPEAGQLVARAAFVGGVQSTSNVEAGRRLGIPVKGTFAHSWVMTFESEKAAFEAYRRAFPKGTTVLLDTYDTLEGARKVVEMGPPILAVRLDSGDLLDLSRKVRTILDQGGLRSTKILASGDLNEEKIESLERAGAPIDIYGVGTELATSKDMPALGGVYKLVEHGNERGETVATAKRSEGKATWPGAKQVYRRSGPDGRHTGDTIALAHEPALPDKPLLEQVMAGGKRLRPPPSLVSLQAHCAREVGKLPEDVLAFMRPAAYPVARSQALEALARDIAARGR